MRCDACSHALLRKSTIRELLLELTHINLAPNLPIDLLVFTSDTAGNKFVEFRREPVTSQIEELCSRAAPRAWDISCRHHAILKTVTLG